MMWLRKSIIFTCFFAVIASSCGRGNVSEKVEFSVSGIIHGEEVDQDEYSFVAKILQDNQTICTAILLNNDTALSAAHCFEHYLPDEISNGSTTRQIAEIIINPDFDYGLDNYSDNDIAIIKLESGDQFNVKKYPKITALKKQRSTFLVVGHGNDENNISALRTKTIKEVPIRRRCYKNTKKIITTNTAIYGADSGGALLTKNDLGESLNLVGISSAFYKGDFCRANSIFVNLADHLSWIEKFI